MSFKSLNKKRYMVDQPDQMHKNPATGGFVYVFGRTFKVAKIFSFVLSRDNSSNRKTASITSSVSHT